MASLFRNRITAIWLLLVAATLLSWESARVGFVAEEHRFVTSAIMLVAFVKVRFVGLHFMELRQAPLPLRLLFEAWLVVVCAAILIVYWSGLR
jgi:Prokaryotic Cytochrome C oxidase subunit IV